jgi:hypothetical protein
MGLKGGLQDDGINCHQESEQIETFPTGELCYFSASSRIPNFMEVAQH